MPQKKWICGIFGFPIGHSASPAMHASAFQALGMDGVYLAFEIRPGDLQDAVRAVRILGFSGVNVTLPYKEKVIPWLDRLSPEAERVGAVNTVKNEKGRLVGFNTDGLGFERALNSMRGPKLAGSHVVLIGAGGAAKAVAIQCGLAGAQRLTVVNRNKTRRADLIRRLSRHFPNLELRGFCWGNAAVRSEVQDCDCLVNATSLGMRKGDDLPTPADWIHPGTYVYDLVYRPFRTRWVRLALARGCRAAGGFSMLLHQGALSFEIWTGRKPPIEVMRRALMKQLKEINSDKN